MWDAKIWVKKQNREGRCIRAQYLIESIFDSRKVRMFRFPRKIVNCHVLLILCLTERIKIVRIFVVVGVKIHVAFCHIVERENVFITLILIHLCLFYPGQDLQLSVCCFSAGEFYSAHYPQWRLWHLLFAIRIPPRAVKHLVRFQIHRGH